MTLQRLIDEGASFAVNDLTGEMVSLVSAVKPHETLLPGDGANPKVLCQLLFNEKDVRCSWSKISFDQAAAKLAAHAQAPVF